MFNCWQKKLDNKAGKIANQLTLINSALAGQ